VKPFTGKERLRNRVKLVLRAGEIIRDYARRRSDKTHVGNLGGLVRNRRSRRGERREKGEDGKIAGVQRHEPGKRCTSVASSE